VLFLESMWNHGEAMNRERQLDDLMWPTFTTTEMADLLAYVYNLPSLPSTPARLQLGNSAAGMKVFEDLACSKCHSVLEDDPDLLAFTQSEREHRTVTGLAVAMWNHRPIMEEWSKETGLPIRNFEQGQMGQLLSYLFEEGFLEERGNAERGEALYTDKGCAQCHDNGIARPLPRTSYTVTDVTAGMWRHGPEVRQAMGDQRMTWPYLSASDIADLVAWLNVR
jgi:cytochrome c2